MPRKETELTPEIDNTNCLWTSDQNQSQHRPAASGQLEKDQEGLSYPMPKTGYDPLLSHVISTERTSTLCQLHLNMHIFLIQFSPSSRQKWSFPHPKPYEKYWLGVSICWGKTELLQNNDICLQVRARGCVAVKNVNITKHTAQLL